MTALSRHPEIGPGAQDWCQNAQILRFRNKFGMTALFRHPELGSGSQDWCQNALNKPAMTAKTRLLGFIHAQNSDFFSQLPVLLNHFRFCVNIYVAGKCLFNHLRNGNCCLLRFFIFAQKAV